MFKYANEAWLNIHSLYSFTEQKSEDWIRPDSFISLFFFFFFKFEVFTDGIFHTSENSVNSQLVNQSVSQLIDRSVSQSVNQSVSQSINQSIQMHTIYK